MLNELNVRINKEDEVAMKKWADFMEANKWAKKVNCLIRT
jgi:hypothetical protein